MGTTWERAKLVGLVSCFRTWSVLTEKAVGGTDTEEGIEENPGNPHPLLNSDNNGTQVEEGCRQQ